MESRCFVRDLVPLRSGFTLIELLVGISIILILAWQGLVNYQEFNRKQQVEQAALDYVSALRNAQNRAKTGDKPSGDWITCAEFDGMQVSSVSLTNEYTIIPSCDEGRLIMSRGRQETFRSELVGFLANRDVTFDALYGTVAADTTFTIQHTVDTSISEDVVVTMGGDIICSTCD